jgi:hypothetical protein
VEAGENVTLETRDAMDLEIGPRATSFYGAQIQRSLVSAVR